MTARIRTARGRSASILLLLGLSVVAASPAAASDADVEAAMSIGGSLGNQLGELARNYTGLAAEKVDMTLDIVEARRAFWNAYPDGPGLEEARARLAEALFAKDTLYLEFALMGDVMTSRVQTGRRQWFLDRIQTNLDVMDTVMGGVKVDGGIRESAFREFGHWVETYGEALADELDGQLLNLLQPGVRERAQLRSAEAYRKYVEMRDIAEFDAAGVPLPGTDTPVGWVRALMRRVRFAESWPEAGREAEAMVQAVGEDVVADAVRTVRELRRTEAPLRSVGLIVDVGDGAKAEPVPEGYVVTPSAHPYSVFMTLVGKTGPRAYYLVHHALNHGGSWQTVVDGLRSRSATYGEDTVLEAAAKVQAAPRLSTDVLVDPAALGVESTQPWKAFEELLRNGNRGGLEGLRVLVYSTVELDDRRRLQAATDPEERVRVADAILEELVAEHGRDAVLAAGSKVEDLHGTEAYATFRMLLGTGSNNPEFEAWRGFDPGATAVYAVGERGYRGWRERRLTVTLREKGDVTARLHVASEPAAGSEVPSEPREKSLLLRAWIPNSPPFVGSGLFLPEPVRRTNAYTLEDLGTQTLEIDGTEIACERRTVSHRGTPWAVIGYSDAVPGRLVEWTADREGERAFEVRLLEFRDGQPDARPEVAESAGAATDPLAQVVAAKPPYDREVPERWSYSGARQRPELLNGDDLEAAVAIRYPAKLRKAGIGGDVRVRVYVDEDGWVRRAVLMDGTDVEALDSVALELAQGLRYEPARDEDGPIASWWFQAIRFE